MAQAPRPGSVRQAEQEAAAEAAHITFELEGKTYTVRPGEVPSSLASEFRHAAGMSFRAAVELMTTDPDIDILRPLVFLARRQAGEKIAIDDVDDFTYEQSKSLTFLEEPNEDPDDPQP